MKRFSPVLFSLPVALLILGLSEPNPNRVSLRAPTIQKHRGVSWVGGHQPVVQNDFEPLVRNHVNWIVQTPFGWQRSYDSPTIKMATSGNVYWGETDLGIETTTRLAKGRGIRTLLKPHIWLHRSSNGKWRGEIEMSSAEEWQQWFANYRKFILHYARLAEKLGIEALSIGTELRTTAVQREQDWRNLIAEVRKIYHGKLTYSANWYLEFEEVRFWDALDFIGVQAYFPLSDKENPGVAELISGWQSHKTAIKKVSTAFSKPVIFTEIGYKSRSDTAIRPWEWPNRSSTPATAAELQTQANCYEAFFKTFWNQEWCAGAYFWKWFPKLSERKSGNPGRDFTPQNKPAERVMARWFATTSD